MAGSKTRNRNAGKSSQKERYLVGTETPVFRLQTTNPGGNKRRFVWAVKEEDGYRHVSVGETELRY